MKTDQIVTRVTSQQRQQLELIVRHSGIGDLSDHVRKAIDEYITRYAPSNEQKQPSATD